MNLLPLLDSSKCSTSWDASRPRQTLPICFLLTITLISTLTACGRDAPPPLESYWQVPDFSLTNQRGETVSRGDLVGRVWVADFFFTECPGICPIMSGNLKALQDAVADEPRARDVRLVSFSVDPERDTVEKLAAHAADLGVEPGFWHLLTGPREAIWDVAVQGFKLPVSANLADPANPVSHSGKFVLVDRTGTIRGLYDGTDPDSVAAVERDLRRLLDEPAAVSTASR